MKTYITAMFIVLLSGLIQAQSGVNYTGNLNPKIYPNYNAPDLIVTKIKIASANPYKQLLYSRNTSKLAVDVTVKNQGKRSARGHYGIFLELTMGPIIKRMSKIGWLAAGQSRTVRVTAEISLYNMPKCPVFIATIDPPVGSGRNGQVNESNERNNKKRVTICLPSPNASKQGNS